MNTEERLGIGLVGVIAFCVIGGALSWASSFFREPFMRATWPFHAVLCVYVLAVAVFYLFRDVRWIINRVFRFFSRRGD